MDPSCNLVWPLVVVWSIMQWESTWVVLQRIWGVVLLPWSAFYVLSLAWSMEFHYVILEMDSTAALLLIRNRVDRNHPYSMVIINCIKELLNRDWVVHLTHIYCEVNRVADYLASLSHADQLGVRYLISPPEILGPFLRDDVMRWLYHGLLPLPSFFLFCC